MSLPAFLASHSSKIGDGFIETARLIAGENPPQWLAEHLQRWSPSVMLDGHVHAKQLGKAEARARLQKLREAAHFVGRELHDPVIVAPLLAAEFGPLPDSAGLDTMLREIGRRADIVSSRIDLLGTGLDERVEHLSDGAGLIVGEVQDPELSEFLKAEQIIGPPAPTVRLGALLREIERQAGAGLLSPYLTNELGKTKAGRSRALPAMASTPKAFCAAIILEAWAHFHDGDYPQASNHAPLWAAAKEYWRACGGEAKGWNNGQLPAWRPYFKEAAADPLATVRKELRRHLIASSANN